MPNDNNAAPKKKLTLSKEALDNLRVRSDIKAGLGADVVPPYPHPHVPVIVLPK
jgi:hypothetical protein